MVSLRKIFIKGVGLLTSISYILQLHSRRLWLSRVDATLGSTVQTVGFDMSCRTYRARLSFVEAYDRRSGGGK